MDQPTLESQLRWAYDRLADKGLLATGQGSVAIRDPRSGDFLRWDGAGDVQEKRLQESLTIESLIFARRPGVGGVIVAQPSWGVSLHRIDCVMPALFDEQVRQLGPSVETLDWSPGQAVSTSDAGKLARGDAVYLWNGQVLVLGYTLERAVFNLELFEKCAKSYLLAHQTGGSVSQVPWWVRLIAFRRLRRDEKKAALAYQQRVMPTGLGSY
jgi:ribulose-5-phosphate 4-epimerase/fuculose-1-phosphate aldolase